MPRRKFLGVLPFFVVLVALFVPSAAHAQQQPELDALAAQTASKINKSAKVLVIDFADPNAKASQLGVELADEFAAALRNTSRGLVVIDRADYTRAAAEDLLSLGARAEESTATCYGRQLAADLTVIGTIHVDSGKLQLALEVTKLEDRKKNFKLETSLPLTPELQTLRSKPALDTPVSPPPSKNVWIGSDSPLGTGDTSAVGDAGARKGTPPRCVYCPNAQFSDAAVKAKVQGSVLLSAIIDATGQPVRISVTKGIPCGLNRQAIEGVKQWTFKPAEDANGNPVAVRQSIEVTFHLY